MIGRNILESKGDSINTQRSKKDIIIRNPQDRDGKECKNSGFRLFSVVCYAVDCHHLKISNLQLKCTLCK